MTKRIGRAGYARILAYLRDKPSTIQGATDAGLAGKTALWHAIPGLHRLGLLYVSGWVVVGKRARYSAVYAYGSAPDAPAPLVRPNGDAVRAPSKPPSGQQPRSELIAFVGLMRSLVDAKSLTEHAEDCGITLNSVCKIMKTLRRLGLVHLHAWEKRGNRGGFVALYRLGRRADQVRPKPKPRTQINADFRARRARFSVGADVANACHMMAAA